jgi:hypothetical protein
MNDLNLEKKTIKKTILPLLSRGMTNMWNRKKRVVQYDCMSTIFLSLYL